MEEMIYRLQWKLYFCITSQANWICALSTAVNYRAINKIYFSSISKASYKFHTNFDKYFLVILANYYLRLDFVYPYF